MTKAHGVVRLAIIEWRVRVVTGEVGGSFYRISDVSCTYFVDPLLTYLGRLYNMRRCRKHMYGVKSQQTKHALNEILYLF